MKIVLLGIVGLCCDLARFVAIALLVRCLV